MSSVDGDKSGRTVSLGLLSGCDMPPFAVEGCDPVRVGVAQCAPADTSLGVVDAPLLVGVRHFDR